MAERLNNSVVHYTSSPAFQVWALTGVIELFYVPEKTTWTRFYHSGLSLSMSKIGTLINIILGCSNLWRSSIPSSDTPGLQMGLSLRYLLIKLAPSLRAQVLWKLQMLFFSRYLLAHTWWTGLEKFGSSGR